MKKFFLTALLTSGVLFSAAFAGEFDDKGLVSGWKFTPLQLDAGMSFGTKLFDESSDTFLSLGLILLQQRSAVISVALLVNTLQNNYGLQCAPLFLGTATDCNYGISLGFTNYSKKCYGIQAGILNYSFAGAPVEKENEQVQLCGINIADTLYLGLLNATDKFQIGLFNLSKGAAFQIGLLNFNPRSYVPWLPLINFDMGRTYE